MLPRFLRRSPEPLVEAVERVVLPWLDIQAIQQADGWKENVDDHGFLSMLSLDDAEWLHQLRIEAYQ